MGKVKDKQTIIEMTREIERYFKNRTDLTSVTDVLEQGTQNLDTVDAEWKKQIFGEWIELEILCSIILERDDKNAVPTEKEKSAIQETLVSIEKILSQINSSIEEYYCPSCGADLSDSDVWTKTEESNDICYCCGLSFNRQPPSLTAVKAARDQWLLHPEFWKEPSALPEDWRIEDQMDNIPLAYL
jgi:hypothetical protein